MNGKRRGGSYLGVVYKWDIFCCFSLIAAEASWKKRERESWILRNKAGSRHSSGKSHAWMKVRNSVLIADGQDPLDHRKTTLYFLGETDMAAGSVYVSLTSLCY